MCVCIQFCSLLFFHIVLYPKKCLKLNYLNTSIIRTLGCLSTASPVSLLHPFTVKATTSWSYPGLPGDSSFWNKVMVVCDHPGTTPSSGQDWSSWPVDVAPSSLFLVSQTLQLVQEAAVGGWGIRPQFLVPVVSFGLPLRNLACWFWALGSLLHSGFLWGRSLISQQWLWSWRCWLGDSKAADFSVLSVFLSPSPCSWAHSGCVVLVHLQTGAEAEPGQDQWGHPGEKLLQFSLVFPSVRGSGPYLQPRDRTEGTG